MFKKLFLMLMVLIMLFVLLPTGKANAVAWPVDTIRWMMPKTAFYETVPMEWVDVPTADPNLIVVSMHVSTAALVAGTTGFTLLIASQTDYPRNYTCIISSRAEGAAVVGSLEIIGTDSIGTARTETIAISSVTASGNYPFAYVTSVRVTITSIADNPDGGNLQSTDCSIDVGTGVKMGLCTNIYETTDVFTVLEDGAATDPSGKANATYNTIDFASDPDASKDYEIAIRAPMQKWSPATQTTVND